MLIYNVQRLLFLHYFQFLNLESLANTPVVTMGQGGNYVSVNLSGLPQYMVGT